MLCPVETCGYNRLWNKKRECVLHYLARDDLCKYKEELEEK